MAERVVHIREGDIDVIELCSPPANLTDQLFFTEIAEIVDSLEKSGDCCGVIVRGRGRHFSSGADIDELVRRWGDGNGAGVREARSRSAAVFESLAKLRSPVVAAIQGCCLGSGMELALACHYRIAVANALFSMPEAGYGLMPGCGGTVRLPRLIGVGRSIELILSGRNLLAEDALQINLVDMIVQKSELMDSARKVLHSWGGKKR